MKEPCCEALGSGDSRSSFDWQASPEKYVDAALLRDIDALHFITSSKTDVTPLNMGAGRLV